MNRRSFITVMAAGLVVPPLGAGAQPAAAKPVRVGVLRALQMP
jgi:hypothetical protein